MLSAKVLGSGVIDAIPSDVHGIPVYVTGQQRQEWDAHIVVGVLDVSSPDSCVGYDWDATVIAYRAWHPGPHGEPCPCCDDPAETDLYGFYTWGRVKEARLPVDRSADERVDLGRLTAAIRECGNALAALPKTPLTWVAYGPRHDYGRWATPERAAEWLASHMERLAADPNLGEERQQAARDSAARLHAGARTVTIGGKTYGITRSLLPRRHRDRLLTLDQVLEYLADRGRTMKPATWRSYVANGWAPQPSERVGREPRWRLGAVEEYANGDWKKPPTD